MKRLPPLNALRAFEAAARFESFNRAAKELHVTPSAVSHQIRTLEEFLGSDLFLRQARKVRLSEVGREFLPAVHDALEQIAVAAERVLERGGSSVLMVSSAPSFLVGWLVPRLSEFQIAHPGIEVRFDTSPQLTDLRSSDVDACIRYAAADTDFGDVCSHWLFGEELVPICSPALVGNAGILQEPADLARVTLLHSFSRTGQWRAWLRAAGVEGIDTEHGPRFSSDAIAVEAAAVGLGVALASRAVVARQLAEGRVVVPFDVGYCNEYGYYLVHTAAMTDDPRIVAFREWLLERVAGTDETSAFDRALRGLGGGRTPRAEPGRI